MAKQDKRIARSIKLMKESYLQLLKEKPMEKISVVEICERAGISRYTFYSHYEDINALRNDLQQQLCREFFSSVNLYKFDRNSRPALDALVHQIRTEPDLFALLFGTSISKENMVALIEDLFQLTLPVWSAHSALPQDQIRLIYCYMISGIFSMVREWYQSGFSTDEETIKDLMENLVRHGVYHYIYTK